MKIVKTMNKLDFTLLNDGSMSVYLALLNVGYKTDIYSRVQLIIDTGASRTLISAATILDLGYQRLATATYSKVNTFAEPIICHHYEIPSFRLAGDLLVKKPTVWVPDGSQCVDNVLGQDILKEYNYYIDNDDCCIYFEPKLIINLF